MGRLPEAWIAPAELREFTRHRQRLVGLRTSYKDQVDAVLAKLGIPVTCPGIFGTAGDQPVHSRQVTVARTRPLNSSSLAKLSMSARRTANRGSERARHRW